MNLVQRLVTSHFLNKKQGTLGGRPGPGVSIGGMGSADPQGTTHINGHFG
jgi:hypothetical protein